MKPLPTVLPLPPKTQYSCTRTREEHPPVTVTDSLPREAHTSAGKRECASYARARVTVTDLPNLLGVPSLRDYQVGPIEAAAGGRDVLTIFPTGSGKSLIFTGAGLLRGGPTLCVYPLRALIHDQHRRFEANGLPVRKWNSDVGDKDKDETLTLIGTGWWGFLLTTPESLKGRDLSFALKGRVNLAVVDEAHCVLKERGFRVSYAWLGNTLADIGYESLIAATATLPAQDRQHLIRSLKMRDPSVFTMLVARGNIAISTVDRSPYALIDILNRHHGQPGIVFAATVATATKLHEQLRSSGRNVGLYHGRLPAKEKTAAQQAFMNGETPVMLTTDAFLLGVDKPDIRFICHYDHPKSTEDWVQGFGRAGRDGDDAFAYGCFRGSREGLSSRAFLINASYPPVPNIRALWEWLRGRPFSDLTADAIGERVLGRAGRHSGRNILSALKRYHLLDVQVNPADRRRRIYKAKGVFDAAPWQMYEVEKQQARQRFDTFCELVSLPDAEIPEAIDAYFGEEPTSLDGADYPASWDEVAE